MAPRGQELRPRHVNLGEKSEDLVCSVSTCKLHSRPQVQFSQIINYTWELTSTLRNHNINTVDGPTFHCFLRASRVPATDTVSPHSLRHRRRLFLRGIFFFMFMYGGGGTYHSTGVKVRGQPLGGTNSLLLPCVFQGSNSGY